MLRRLISLILSFCLVIGLCACSNMKVPFKVQDFTGGVSFQSAGTDFSGEITYLSPENISLKIKEPENIKDIEFNYDGEEMKVALGEIAFCDETKKESPIYVLLDIISTLAKSDIAIPLKGENEVVLSHGDEQYSVTIDCENKKLLSAKSESFSYIFE